MLRPQPIEQRHVSIHVERVGCTLPVVSTQSPQLLVPEMERVHRNQHVGVGVLGHEARSQRRLAGTGASGIPMIRRWGTQSV